MPAGLPAQHRNASSSSSSSPSSGTSALSPDVEPVEPEPLAEVAAPAQAYVPPPPPPEPKPNPPCPTAKNIEVTAALIGMTPFSDTAHGITLTGWKYKVRTTVRNTAAVSATVVTSVAVNGPHGMIDSSVESVEVPANGSQSVTSFEMISYDDKPVGLQVDQATNDLGQITSMEPCQA